MLGWMIFSQFVLISLFFSSVKSLYKDLNTVVKSEGSEDRLLLTQILYRHGDRSPAVTFKNNPIKESSWPQGFGQLSQIGMHQHYELGQFFRRRYMESQPYRHLNASYNRHEIYVQSTDYDRTLMSAYCNLAGLYPPSGSQVWNSNITWQPIPVHTVPKEDDHLLYMDAKCPKFDEIYQNELHSPEIEKEERDNKDFYAFINNVTGETHESIATVWDIFDPLFCERIHNFSLPDWVNEKFNNQTVYEKLEWLDSFQFEIHYNRGKESRLRGGNLLGTMVKNMNRIGNKLEVGKALKAYFYSAHDSTVAAFLSALKVFNHIAPPYASAVLIELLEKNDKSRYVQVLYRNDSKREPYILQIPGCNSNCPVDQFILVTKDNIPTDWHAECQTENQDWYILIAVGVSLVALLVIVLISYFVLHKKQARVYRRYSELPSESD